VSSYNETLSADQNSGVYIGEDGIRLGQNFKVNASGNLIAQSCSFDSGNLGG
jgi:hypothetical protein